MRVLNEVWGALRAHSRAGPTFHDGNSNFLILRIFYLSCLGKLTLYLKINPLVPQLIAPNRRFRWDIGAISEGLRRAAHGWRRNLTKMVIDLGFGFRGPGFGSPARFVHFFCPDACCLARPCAQACRPARVRGVMSGSPRPLTLTLNTPMWIVIEAQPVR